MSCRRHPPLDVSIRIARAADRCFIDSLQKRFSNQLGFLPDQALREYIDASRVLLALENGEPAGYVITRPRLNSARWCRPLTQVAVCMDAQRRHIGLQLLDRVSLDAHNDLLEGLQCWVRDGIDAVAFFKTADFSLIGTRDSENARGRRLLLFRKPLQRFLPHGFTNPPTVAGCIPRRTAGQRFLHATPLRTHLG